MNGKKHEHNNITLLPNNVEPSSNEYYIQTNNTLLKLSKRFDKKYKLLKKQADEMIQQANELNAETANFNASIYAMKADLDGIINYIKQHPNSWGN